MNKLLIVITSILLTACSRDPNGLPKYGEESHLPANCRAYVQESIQAWRSGAHSTEETMETLERNCGLNGQLWDYKP